MPFNPQDYVEEEAEEVQYRGNEYQVCLTMYCKQDNDVAEEEAAEEVREPEFAEFNCGDADDGGPDLCL